MAVKIAIFTVVLLVMTCRAIKYSTKQELSEKDHPRVANTDPFTPFKLYDEPNSYYKQNSGLYSYLNNLYNQYGIARQLYGSYYGRMSGQNNIYYDPFSGGQFYSQSYVKPSGQNVQFSGRYGSFYEPSHGRNDMPFDPFYGQSYDQSSVPSNQQPDGRTDVQHGQSYGQFYSHSQGSPYGGVSGQESWPYSQSYGQFNRIDYTSPITKNCVEHRQPGSFVQICKADVSYASSGGHQIHYDDYSKTAQSTAWVAPNPPNNVHQIFTNTPQTNHYNT